MQQLTDTKGLRLSPSKFQQATHAHTHVIIRVIKILTTTKAAWLNIQFSHLGFRTQSLDEWCRCKKRKSQRKELDRTYSHAYRLCIHETPGDLNLHENICEAEALLWKFVITKIFIDVKIQSLAIWYTTSVRNKQLWLVLQSYLSLNVTLNPWENIEIPHAIPCWIQAGSKSPVCWWDYSRKKLQAVSLLWKIKLKMLHF